VSDVSPLRQRYCLVHDGREKFNVRAHATACGLVIKIIDKKLLFPVCWRARDALVDAFF